MAVEESSHARPLPEAKPTAETTWLRSKAQVCIYSFWVRDQYDTMTVHEVCTLLYCRSKCEVCLIMLLH